MVAHPECNLWRHERLRDESNNQAKAENSYTQLRSGSEHEVPVPKGP